jgi:SAM-dependent methyltransferase
MLRELKRLWHRLILSAVPFMVYLLKIPYWILLKSIVRYWGKTGLHPMVVGEFVGGETKTRSFYREDMLLRTIMLATDLRDKSLLDLACNDGFWSFRLARFGLKSVTGIDLNSTHIAKANFLKYVYDVPSFTFKREDLFEFLAATGKTYDIVLLLSVLYHLPEKTDWPRFFSAISRINNECLVIDSRWFEDDNYWYDKTSGQAVIKTAGGLVKKWRPVRKEIFNYLSAGAYEYVTEINPSIFLRNPEEACGSGEAYGRKVQVADYVTGNRSLIIGYKTKRAVPAYFPQFTDSGFSFEPFARSKVGK